MADASWCCWPNQRERNPVVDTVFVEDDHAYSASVPVQSLHAGALMPSALSSAVSHTAQHSNSKLHTTMRLKQRLQLQVHAFEEKCTALVKAQISQGFLAALDGTLWCQTGDAGWTDTQKQDTTDTGAKAHLAAIASALNDETAASRTRIQTVGFRLGSLHFVLLSWDSWAINSHEVLFSMHAVEKLPGVRHMYAAGTGKGVVIGVGPADPIVSEGYQQVLDMAVGMWNQEPAAVATTTTTTN
jgi:hypothetical protein